MSLLSIVLSITTLFGLKISYDTLKSKDVDDFKIKELYSSDFSKRYYCYEYENIGYEIVDRDTNMTIEFSPTSLSPYSNIDNDILIYDGPMNYTGIDSSECDFSEVCSYANELES